MRIADDPAFRGVITSAPWMLDFALLGHWDLGTVQRFGAALREAVTRLPGLGVRPGEQVALFDITGFAVQSPDVLAAIGEIADRSRTTSRKIALIRNSALLSMQVKRALPHLPMFDSREEALVWLREEEAA
ncbi:MULTISPECIES: hypothetical protein [unclassified Sphingomonas]|uniref:hypothetical protein n=1 Tax=unclassified Sphingomonas TaxID=196159 RepID=UPI0006FB10AE|nr:MULTISPECIES: hypothetical protein [unclassified Sphingomonas]KQM62097.1 hypothetical protein ASE65_03495 [Sphingomonas sp. Leaf16]KQN13498.1 hypothetical protein ASE81_03565 [Sphingomonas sp. Leaf29]KQN23267.1 hypothetical protein ASE83_01845 [Sphingomonas sp. Leaf32]